MRPTPPATKNDYVLETVVTVGNVHNSVAFDEVYDKVTQTFLEIETIVADSAYKTPHMCKKAFSDGGRCPPTILPLFFPAFAACLEVP